MTARRYSIAPGELKERMRTRLLAGTSAPDVVWRDLYDGLTLHTLTLQVRALKGWVLCGLDVTPSDGARETVQIAFRLGEDGLDDGPDATATFLAGSAALQERWGSALQRVLWDGVLDLVEGAVTLAGRARTDATLQVLGFVASDDAISVDINFL